MIDDFKAVLENCKGLPGEFFTSEEIFAAECEHLFVKSWTFAGLTDDVASTGEVYPTLVANQPVVLTRAKDGNIRAFHNVCRHRGALLATDAKSNQKRLVCPYHAWSYGLDGTLERTPHVGGFGKHSCNSLPTDDLDLLDIRTAVWGPFIFVNLRGDAIDFADYIRPIEQRMNFIELDKLRLAPESHASIDVKANWKLVVENYVESYHVPLVHPELEGVNPMSDHYQILGGDSYVGQGGIAADLEAQLESPLPIFTGAKNAAAYEGLYIFPGLIITCLPSAVAALIPCPIAPDLTRERVAVFFVGDEALRDDLSNARETLVKDWVVRVNNQDIGIIENVQRGRNSKAFDGGRFARGQEQTSLHFQQMIAERMLKALEPDYASQFALPVEDIFHDRT